MPSHSRSVSDLSDTITRTGPPASRRVAKARAAAEGASSQCASSTASTTRRSSASVRSSDSSAVPTRRRSAGRSLARLQHRDLERVPLRRRQVFEETRVELGQQVGQPGEREGRLRLGRAGREDERVELARQPDGGFPDGGLADSGLPDDRERGLGFVGPKELRDLGELGLAPDERGHGQRVVDAD